MKKLIYFLTGVFILVACAPDRTKTQTSSSEDPVKDPVATSITEGRGIGQVTQVTLKTPLEQERVSRGKDVYEMKCQACHRLDDKRIVGPGWKDVTKNRKPEWIMNMITDVEMMLENDPEAQKLLELCLVRMPNQNVSVGDARDILEFMRENDGEQ